MDKISRRSFINKTVMTGAGIAAFPMIFIPKARANWAPNMDATRQILSGFGYSENDLLAGGQILEP